MEWDLRWLSAGTESEDSGPGLKVLPVGGDVTGGYISLDGRDRETGHKAHMRESLFGWVVLGCSPEGSVRWAPE